MDLELRPVWIVQLSNTSYQVILGQSLCLLEWKINIPDNFEKNNKVTYVFINHLHGYQVLGKEGEIFWEHMVKHLWKIVPSYDDNCH